MEMDDDLMKLEHVLRDRAAEVPYLQEVPRHMLVRARRRVARNALSSVAAAALIIIGASAGLAGLGSLRGPDVTLSDPSGVQSPLSTPSCGAANLRATAALEGAAGSVLGSIDLTNVGSSTCTLSGRPVLTILSSAGLEVPVDVVEAVPQWQADGSPTPPGWPVVSLRPGSAATIRVRWSNACPQLSDPALWKVDLGTEGGSVDVSGADATFPPPCNGPSEPSTLEVGPYEPSAGA
jgi:hypothetical protein